MSPASSCSQRLTRFLKQHPFQSPPTLPPTLKEVVSVYQTLGISSVDWETEPRRFLAELLEKIWWHEIHTSLLDMQAPLEDWLQAVAFLSRYVTPLIENYPQKRKIKQVSTQLSSETWLERWIKNRKRCKKILDRVAGDDAPDTRSISRWTNQGAIWWCRGLKRWLQHIKEQNLPPLNLQPAAIHVARPDQLAELERHFEAALQDNQWLAVTGLPGIGKTTLLGDFIRALQARSGYLERVFSGGMAVVSPPRREERKVPYLSELVSQITDRPVALTSELTSHLQDYLNGRRALFVVDNISNPSDLKRLRDIPEIMVLITLRSPDAATALDIPIRYQMQMKPLTFEQSRELLIKCTGVEPGPKDENRPVCDNEIASEPEAEPEQDAARDTLQTLVELVHGHPQALKLVASRGKDDDRDADRFWEKKLRKLQDLEARQGLFGYDTDFDMSDDSALTLDLGPLLATFWQDMPRKLREEALPTLVSVPRFSCYDVALGQAVWRDISSKTAAEERWSELVQWQVVEPLAPSYLKVESPTAEVNTRPRYRIHSLIYDFLLQEQVNPNKAKKYLTAIDTCGWIWRYSLQEAWPDKHKPWHPCKLNVPPSPESLLQHLKWAFHLPKTSWFPKPTTVLQHFKRRYWDRGTLYLQVTPLVWVLISRSRLMVWLGIVIDISLIVARRALSQWTWIIFALMTGVTAWLLILIEDQMRIYGWQRHGKTLDEVLEEADTAG